MSFLFYCSAKTLPGIFDDSLAESIVPPRDQLATYDVPIFKYNDLSKCDLRLLLFAVWEELSN